MTHEQKPGQSIATEGQGSYDGDVILENLEMGTKAGFSKVAKFWLENGCVSFDDAREQLASEQQQIQDFHSPLEEWSCVVTEEGVAFRHASTGRDYIPTDHALGLVCQVGRGMSSWMVKAMRADIPHTTKKDDDGNAVVIDGGERSQADYECLRDYINLHLFHPQRVDQKKTRLFRTWNDGTMRALLSEQYTIINNLWFLDLLADIIPGGVVSHWRGDADTIYGNILIPDTIRREKDSDFGGMLSIGNSEIATRRISSFPSVFRAVCMNGCIWNHKIGKAINKVHRGTVDLVVLATMIRENLETQIPLLPQGIERMLGLRAFGCGDTPVTNLLAHTATNWGMSKKQVSAVADGWNEEISLLGPKEGRTAYGLLNAVTRAAQTLPPEQWVAFDTIGGEFANMDRDSWDKFRTGANSLNAKQIEKRLGKLVAA